jgi:hypothetical protein
MLNVNKQNVFMLSDFMLSVIMLSDAMLNVVKLNVVMLNVVAPNNTEQLVPLCWMSRVFKCYAECCYAQ